jgi:hypothetical protein
LELNNNRISVEGVAHIVNNKWLPNVSYGLDTATTKDDGYVFNVSDSIRMIKKIV